MAESDKSYGFSHRGTDNQLFVFEAAIDLLSFIQLFPKDWKKRCYLSLGGVSSMALMAFLSERPQITSVFLCLDNDQAGNEACEKLAGEISEGYSVIRLKPSRKDWNEILCDRIIRYLTENRGIEKDLVEKWISSGDIYEEKKQGLSDLLL